MNGAISLLTILFIANHDVICIKTLSTRARRFEKIIL